MKYKLLLATLPLAILTACGGSSDSGSTSGAGKLSLSLTDAPIDEAKHVYVSVKGVSLNREDSGWVDYDLDSVQKVDLLTLQSGKTLGLLDKVNVEPGSYQVRLNLHEDNDNVLDNSIVIDATGAEYELKVPSGAQTGLKANSPVVIPANGTVDYTIDFDVRKSVVKRGNKDSYILKPVLRLVNNVQAGTLTGKITDTSILTKDCSDTDPTTHNTVYVYEGSNVTPDDIGSKGVQPVTTAPLVFDSKTGEYSYTAAFLTAGDYTVSLTCNSDLENVETDDDLKFKNISNQTVVATKTSNTDTEIDSETKKTEALS